MDAAVNEKNGHTGLFDKKRLQQYSVLWKYAEQLKVVEFHSAAVSPGHWSFFCENWKIKHCFR